MKYLKLTLAGILQSYGTGATQWAEFHDTELLPTTSALIGLIGCALGVRKGEDSFEKLKELIFLCVSSSNTEKMTDYQIIAPREYKKAREESHFWTNDGSHSGSQLPVYKTYLVNAEFTVYVGTDDKDELEKIYYSFLNPKWLYFLGRTCCTPSKPIVEKEFTLYTEEKINEEGIVIPCIYT